MCLQDKSPSREHVIPLAIGGALVIDRVCKDCNGSFGQAADAGLIRQHEMAVRRAELNLKGQSGTVPDPFRDALRQPVGVGQNGNHKVILRRKTTGELDARTIPDVVFEVQKLPGGFYVRNERCFIDARERDANKEKIIEDALQKAGLTGDQQIQEAFEKFSSTLVEEQEQTIFQPVIAANMGGHQLGVLKIAYEMAWYWLGDSWLDDPQAAVMRSALRGEAPLMQAALFDPASFFLDAYHSKRNHLIFVFEGKGRLMIVVRLLDVFAVGFVLTDTPKQYTMPATDVLINDAVAKEIQFTSLAEITGKTSD